ncbi:phosphotriesterase-related protein-like isoform X1 [Formica exsecta]|uniref:phosphotriesterase-related protein-like isoform X1 n=1 Tax=Formica exsecta TaxID=72781 RepID=UPI001141A063|nr:phosphotriesterase-related protein-like isoform X1 [Formica exsecta]
MDGNYVETVLGSTRMSKLGTVLTHEYLLNDFSNLYSHSSGQIYDFKSSSLQNFGYVRQYPYSHLYNLRLNDEEGINATINDVKLFKEANGGTIVEKSSCANRNIRLLKSISKVTKVNIIIGTGYHITDTDNALTCTTTSEEMYNQIYDEFENGCKDYRDMKPAFIADGGNILLDFEKRALRAIGEFQGQYRYPVSFHPGKDVIPLIEVMRVYQEAGGQPTEFVMSHIDRTSFSSKEDLMEFIDDTKCYIQFDQFGVESSFYQLNSFIDIMSDAQSIRLIALLKQDKKLNRVLISHDIHTKHRLTAFGGLGYAHITNNVVPNMLKRYFTVEDIILIRNSNPYRWLNRLNL